MVLERLVTAVLITVTMIGSAPSTLAASATSAHAAGSYDRTVGRRDCGLLGRSYDARRGCSRRACVPDAIPYKLAPDAEECALPHQGDYAFGAAVDFRRCRALHRRWIPQVNWCAANPDRKVGQIRNAPQCTQPHLTYVTLTDVEPRYDLCLSSARVGQLTQRAAADHTSLDREIEDRSATLCSYHAGYRFRGHRCVPGRAQSAPTGDVLLVGDSLTWRGTDELAPLRPTWDLDGYPGRRFRDLVGRLDWFEKGHGEPDGLILELGANASGRFTQNDLRRVVDGLPVSTVVMFVLPYRSDPDTGVVARWTTRYASWMSDLAASRAESCVADWRSLVTAHPHLLVDGVHPTHDNERYWASWLSRSWDSCEQSLGQTG